MSKIKAKMVMKKMLGNSGKSVSLSKAMRDIGYSYNYANNSQSFLRTKTAKKLEKKYLDDELIAKRHDELLNAGSIQHYVFPKLSDKKIKKKVNGKWKITFESNQLTNEEIREVVESVPGCRLIYIKPDFNGLYAYFSAPDGRIRKDAIDMAYKLKGKYAPDQVELTTRKYQHLSNAELVELKKKLQNYLLKK